MTSYDDIRAIPKGEEVPNKYNIDIISLIGRHFPEHNEYLVVADKEMREKRLFGKLHITSGQFRAAQVIYQNGAIKMYYLSKLIGNVCSEVTIMNEKISFGKSFNKTLKKR